MSDLDRALMEPIQLKQFSGMLPPRAANPTRLAELQALLAVHKAARPAIPWPMPPVASDDYQAWDRANVAWVDQKARLVCEIEQEQGVIASAWRPCAPPPHALNPNPSPAPPPLGADAEPSRKAPNQRVRRGSGPCPRGQARVAGAPRPGALRLTGSLQQGGVVPVSSASPAVQESLPSPDSLPAPEAPSEARPRRGVGRPPKNPDDPKSLHRRAQYRAAKERARVRTGVIR